MKLCADVRCECWTLTDEDYCYGHAKVRDGLITEYWEPQDKKFHPLAVKP